MKSDKIKFMQMAIDEATKGIKKNHGGPFGAVIVKDNKVIATGHNCVVKNNDSTAHGEMQTIRKACKKLKTFDLKGCEIYTTGYPCPMCFGAILWANMKKIYYGCTLEDNESIGFRDDYFENNLGALQKKMCKELDRSECFELFKNYSKIKDKTKY